MFLSVGLKKHVNICVWMDFEKKKRKKKKNKQIVCFVEVCG